MRNLNHLFIALMFLTLSSVSHTTMIDDRPLKDLVEEASVILEVAVVDVVMETEDGDIVEQADAWTGPGRNTVIFLVVESDRNSTIKGSITDVPARFKVPLWTMWHYTLGQIEGYYENQRVILLLDKDLKRIYPRQFIQDPFLRDAIACLAEST